MTACPPQDRLAVARGGAFYAGYAAFLAIRLRHLRQVTAVVTKRNH